MNLDLSIATRDPVGQRLLSRLRHTACFGGLDLGSVSDLTGFVLAWPIRNFVYIYPWAWIPEDGIAERSKRDNVGYVEWKKRGFIETTPGAVTDWRHVTQRIKTLASIFKIRQISYDRWGARDTVADLVESGIEVADMGQGYGSMNAPARRLEELVLSRHLVHSGHPILRWCIDCTTVIQDPSGNIKPIKPDRQKTSKRIDLTVAAVMAINSVMKKPETPKNGFFSM